MQFSGIKEKIIVVTTKQTNHQITTQTVEKMENEQIDIYNSCSTLIIVGNEQFSIQTSISQTFYPAGYLDIVFMPWGNTALKLLYNFK